MSTTTGMQVRKQLRNTIRRPSIDSKDQGANSGERSDSPKSLSKGDGKRSSAGGTMTAGVRSPRTLAAIAKSLATASAGKVPPPGELFKLSGKLENTARQAAAQAQLRSGPGRRGSRRRSSAGSGDRPMAVAAHVPRHTANAALQRQRREKELEQAAQARQLRQAILAERPLHMGAGSRTLPASLGGAPKAAAAAAAAAADGKGARHHRPSLAATSRDTLTQVYGGRDGRRRPASNGGSRRCSRSLPPPKGRSTPPSSATKRPDGRCTPFSEGCVSPRDDLEVPQPLPRKRKEPTKRTRRPGVATRDRERSPLRKRLRRKTLDKAAKLRRTLVTTRSQTVLQEEEEEEEEGETPVRTSPTTISGSVGTGGSSAGSTHQYGSHTACSSSSGSGSGNGAGGPSGEPCEEELSPLITSISVSTPLMKEDPALRRSKRTVATNTSPPRKRPSPPTSLQEELPNPVSAAQSEVSSSLRDAARAHGLTITNLGGLPDNSLQQNSSTSPLHWSQASEEFLGTFCSAHGLTLVNIAQSFPSPTSSETLYSSLPATTLPATAAAPAWQQPQNTEKPLRYPRPEPDTSPQDVVVVDRTAASVTPGPGEEEVSDDLEGFLRGTSSAQRSPLPSAAKPWTRNASMGDHRGSVRGHTTSADSRGVAKEQDDDDIAADVDDGMRIIDIVTNMRSITSGDHHRHGANSPPPPSATVSVQANLDVPSLPEPPTIMSTGVASTADSGGGLMLVDFNTQRRPPIRISSPSHSHSAGPRQVMGASSSTAGETSDILPESLYDSIGISHISSDDDGDATEEQQPSPTGAALTQCDELEDIYTKAEPVYSTSGSSLPTGTATPSLPSGTASPSTEKEEEGFGLSQGGFQGLRAEDLSHQAQLALDHMDRTDELIRLADCADLQRRHHKGVLQQVGDALAAEERHSQRLARAQQLFREMEGPGDGGNSGRDGTAQTDSHARPEGPLREGEEGAPIPMGVQTITPWEATAPSVEAIGLQTEVGRLEMEIDSEHSLAATDALDQALRGGGSFQGPLPSLSYPMWTQTEAPSRGVDQAVQPTPSVSSSRSNARWDGATGMGDVGSPRVLASSSSPSSRTYSMVGFEDEEATASEVSMVQPGSAVTSSFHSDISLPFATPFSDWRSASTGRGPGSDPEEASILSASAALEGHLNLTYRNLRTERSHHGGAEASEAALRSSHTSLYESRLSNSPSSAASILTELTIDGRHNVSVEEVSGALARRRKKAEEDVEERIRSSKEKMAAGKERDIPSPQKRRRERRRAAEDRKRRQRGAKVDSARLSLERLSGGGQRDSRESSGSSTDSLSIIIRDAERRLLSQQQRLRSKNEAAAKDAKATEEALRDNEAKLRKVGYLKELKREIADARRESEGPFDIAQPFEQAERSPAGATAADPETLSADEEASAGATDAITGSPEVASRADTGEEAIEEVPSAGLLPGVDDDEEALAGTDDDRKSLSSTQQRIHAVEVQNEDDSHSKLEAVGTTLARPELPSASSPDTLLRTPDSDRGADYLEEEPSHDLSDSAVLIADPVEAAKAVAEAKVPSVRKEASTGGAGQGSGGHREYESSSEQFLEVARFEAKSPVVTKESAEDLEIDKMEVVEEAPVQSPELVTVLTRPPTTASSSSSRGSSSAHRVEVELTAGSNSVSPIPNSDALLGWARGLPKAEHDQCIEHVTEHVLESLLDDRALERKILSTLARGDSPVENGATEDACRKLHEERLASSKAAAAAVVEEAQKKFSGTAEMADSVAIEGGLTDVALPAEMQSKMPTLSGYTCRLLWESCIELAQQPSEAHRTCALWSKRFPGTKSPLTPFVAVMNSWTSIQQQLNQILEINSDLRMRAETGLHHSEVQQAEERRVDEMAMRAVSGIAITGVTALFDWRQRRSIRSRILEDVDEQVFGALVEDFALELRDEYEEGGG
ncbi:hypothetical protein FOZ61_002768 [Perkinsus olseni]|uniref:Uncharacterized protein n=1 Tax=Perkinsus olseni TaxID=32597 RepID=A0A7J6MEI1_PEROL|nr:hypothetical protein FOZ61_002768 [Perkinsus olseni]